MFEAFFARDIFQIVEGSGEPLKALSSNVPTDLEVFGSGKGYSSDDEDSEIQGSGGE